MREKAAKPDVQVAAVAARQHGVVSTQQLRDCGLGDDGILRRVRLGRLHRVHRGVYAAGHVALSREGRLLAAVFASGRETEKAGGMAILDFWGAAISHRSAAVLWGLLPDREGSVDVTVPGDGGKERRRGIRLHRFLTLSPTAVTLHNGIPVTTPARTIADLRKAVAGRAKTGVTGRELRRAIRQANVLGLPVDGEARRDRTRSDLERDFLGICRRYRLPSPEVNVRVGPHLVDFLWRDRRLAVETDGFASHRGRQAFEDDRARDLDLRQHGWSVIRLSEKQIDEEPMRVAEVLADALRVGADGRRENE